MNANLGRVVGRFPTMGIVGEAAAERVAGERPSRTRSLVAATVAGVAVAVVTYRLLRSR